ncbi:MAG: low molecular weight phosphotyrosine protein phosphatase [Rickettsiales bacterium]|nr:low molecular weight phosphotyrosine protein phosphatase [Rickettsiales bacterium]
MQAKQKLLFVCTGNICRSPTADAVMRQEVMFEGIKHVECDSAGTQSFHRDEAPDSRAQLAAQMRGYDMSMLRSRKVTPQDYTAFDYLLAMDGSHLKWLQDNRPGGATAKVEMFTDRDMPDPYYGGDQGFELVLDLVEAGIREWIRKLS